MRVLRGLVAALIGLVLTLGAAEGLVRWLQPTPRVQIIRSDEVHGLRQVGGTWLWSAYDEPSRLDVGCPGGDSIDVVLAGSSILYGVRLPPSQGLAARLRQTLAQALGRPVCVVDVSQPGFIGESKAAAVIEQLDAGLRPELVVYEVWANDFGTFQDLGDGLYNLSRFRLDAGGLPAWPAAMSADTRRWGFERSALCAYAVLALGPSEPGEVTRERMAQVVQRSIAPLASEVEAVGARLAMLAAPPLDRPFADSVDAARDPSHHDQAFRAYAEAHGLTYGEIAQMLSGEDHTALRLDACCHYNAEGMARLAERLTPWIAAQLEVGDSDGS